MRIRSLLFANFLFAPLVYAELVPYVESVQINLNGKRADYKDSILVAYGQRLIRSCSYDASDQHGSVAEWDQNVKGSNYLLIKYKKESLFYAAGKDFSIREILIPLPSESWPAYLYGRSNNKVYAFSKWHPQEFADIVCDDSLGLRALEPYQTLCRDWIPSPL